MQNHLNSLRVFSACLFFLSPLALRASSIELRFQEPQRGVLAPRVPVSYSIPTSSQDYMELSIRLVGAPVVARAFDGAGNFIRGTKIELGGNFSFLAPATGRYRIELVAEKATAYHIVWTHVVSVAERLRFRGEPAASAGGPRIEALRKAVASGDAGAVPAFWDETKARGVPLIEPLPGDSKKMSVTFLWKGSPRTRKVLLLWPAENRIEPAACAFSRAWCGRGGGSTR